MPGGRPSKYKKEYCKKLIDHMAKGLSFQTFAVSIGTVRSVTYEWVKKYPEFAAAKQEAEDHCRIFWERLGTGIAAGKLKNGNPAVWIYNMKCRFPAEWKPKKELDISARYEKDVKQLEKMSTDELAQLAKAAAKYLEEKTDA